MEDKYLFCIFIPLFYLIGSINFAVIISTIKNKNIKSLGSGNPGTMNMLRSVGKGWGILTFLLDFAKGVFAGLIGMFVFREYSSLAIYVLGFAVVLGHIFSVFNKFKGGKGVATSLGLFAVANPIAWAVGFITLLVYLKFFKTGFIGSIISISIPAVTAIVMLAIKQPLMWQVAITICAIWLPLIIFTHRENINRLIHGKENSLSLYGKEETVDSNENKEMQE